MIEYKNKYGFIYVAINRSGDEAAMRSLKSLRAHNENIHATLFTDQPAIKGDFDEVIRVDSVDPHPTLKKFPQYPEQGIFAKARLIPRAPYEYCIFSDYDIHFCGSITEIFDLLEKGGFDFVATQDAGGVSMNDLYPEIPHPMVKFHLGILAWHNTPTMQVLFETWRQGIIDKAEQGVAGGMIDEWTFSRAAYLSSARWSVLSSNYCCRFIFPYVIRGYAKAFHGRSEDYASIEEKINATHELRVGQDDALVGKYVPGVGFVRL